MCRTGGGGEWAVEVSAWAREGVFGACSRDYKDK